MKSWRKDIIIITLIYLVAHGLILLNNGIYWDDWVFFLNDNNIKLSREIGNPEQMYFSSIFFRSSYGPILGRVVTFISYYLATIFLYLTIKNITKIDNISRLFLILIFAIFPVNMARIALCDVFYGFCYMMFFFGLWLTSAYIKNRNILLRVITLIVFLISFWTNSLLCFYSVVIIYIVYQDKITIHPIKSLIINIIKYLDFLLLPFVFWVIKIAYFVPYGRYAGYNHLGLGGLLKAPILVVVSFYTSFLQVLDKSLHATSFTVLLLGIIFGCLMLWFIKRDSELLEPEQMDRVNYLFVAFGLVLFMLAVFPYNAVGLIPTNSFWNSRHQLLIPLGAAFILYYGIQCMFEFFDVRKKVQIMFLSLIITMFITVNIQTYVDFQKDWYKQLSIIENIRNSTEVKNHTTFLFDDHYTEANANNRTYSFYEYSGFMKEAFHEETRFGTNLSEFYDSNSGSINSYKMYMNGFYNLGGYVPKDPEYLIEINKGKFDLNNPVNLLRLIYNERFKPEKLSTVVSQAVVIKCNKLDNHYD